jgi:D-alanyl-D-alanine carboxypeptidase/D-alanyl-D-alanine-endopeptidase (penicillin-binding protein 4)
MYAEALLKMVGYKTFGKGTTVDGIKAIESYWKSKKIKMPGFFLADGCGLSPMSAFTADQITEILKISAGAKYFKSFKESLPVAGISGTLTNFCKGTAAENNLCAKSGNMQKVSSYAGYVKSANGEMLCFTISFNNFGADNAVVKKKVEKMMTLLAELN